jgi:hypothetical protein
MEELDHLNDCQFLKDFLHGVNCLLNSLFFQASVTQSSSRGEKSSCRIFSIVLQSHLVVFLSNLKTFSHVGVAHNWHS